MERQSVIDPKPGLPDPGSNELVLVRQAARGDRLAAERLFRLYHQPIHNLVYRMLHGGPETEDLVQEAFLKVFRALPGFRGESSFKTWVYRIATNTCLNWIEKVKHHPVPESLDEPVGEEGDHTRGSMTAGNEIPLEERILGLELEERIQEAIARLTPEFRAVLVLRDLQGLSYEEVAGATGCNLGTVKSRLARARGQCAQHLKDYLR